MFVEMGEIVRAVGLRGEVKAVLTGDFLEDVLESPFLVRMKADDATPARLLRYRWKGETLILALEGIGDRNAAEAAVGDRIGYRSEDYDAPDFPRPPEPAPFLYHGLRVETDAGDLVGEVADVMVLPANLVLRVDTADGKEVLIPVIPPVVEEFDRAGGRLVIRPMPGLLDDDAEVG